MSYGCGSGRSLLSSPFRGWVDHVRGHGSRHRGQRVPERVWTTRKMTDILTPESKIVVLRNSFLHRVSTVVQGGVCSFPEGPCSFPEGPCSQVLSSPVCFGLLLLPPLQKKDLERRTATFPDLIIGQVEPPKTQQHLNNIQCTHKDKLW